jgi:glycosyltransferase involved in cell wall biosynthesis
MLGQTPPPYHGQAIATETLFNHDFRRVHVRTVRMAYSEEPSEVGRFRWSKIAHLWWLLAKCIRELRRLDDAIVYYPPAGPGYVPILRDVIFLVLLKPFARGLVFHFHAGGLGAFLSSRPILRRVALAAYGRPLVSIEISARDEPRISEMIGAVEHAIVPNGLDVPSLAPERRRSDPPVVLFVGSLSESKGVLDVIETAAILRSRGRPTSFRIVGAWKDEVTRRRALELIERHGLHETVAFLGLVTGDEKWELYRSSDLFLFPSHFEAENFPLVLLEAMAFGLPTVSTDWRGIPEIVDHEVTGLVLPIKRPDLYAAAVEDLLFGGVAEFERYASAGRARYEERFTASVFCEAVESALVRAWELSEERAYR